MNHTKEAVKRHNNWLFWGLLAIFVWYASPVVIGTEMAKKEARE